MSILGLAIVILNAHGIAGAPALMPEFAAMEKKKEPKNAMTATQITMTDV